MPKTYPSFIRAKAPEIQLTKDFGSSDEAAVHRKSLQEAYTKFLDDSLQKCIQAKADDVLFLEKSLDLKRIYQDLFPIVKQRGDALIKSSEIPTWVKGPETGEVVLGDWVKNPVTIKIYNEVAEDVVVFAHRVISIVESREHMAKVKLEKKKALAHDADVEMGDATAPGPSIQKMVAEAVSAQLKKKLPGPKKQDAKANKKASSSTSKSAKRPPQVTPYVPKAGRKPPKAIKGGKTSKNKGGKGKDSKGKGKAKA
ncbi:hypothetical protein HWV62_4039 [Athelia sp. TMB]|nr:hypothetical protein HWV62_4039 [Athelia sp. TMB]